MINYIQMMWQFALEGEARGIFFWGAVYVCTVCAYSVLHQIRINRWPAVVGTLAEREVRKWGTATPKTSEQQYVASALYRYRVDGVEYTGRRVSPWIISASHNLRFMLRRQMQSIQDLPDGRVRVFYNPRRPHKSFLIKPGLTGQVFTALTAVAPAGLYWLKFHS